MKRLFCILMALVMLVGTVASLSGCAYIMDMMGEDDNATGTTDENGVATLLTDLAIVENGAANYILVYPSVPTVSEKEAANIIRDKIKTVTGVLPEVINEDFIDEEEGVKFIYVGDTSFDPAEDAKEELLSKGFSDAYVISESNGYIYFVFYS